ncbi:MAG: Fis family transcriptional regulator [Ignavibacteriae bacterium HGW-Ignavibacteriae-4]|nr:MAG: Fis family transcriptional regulator [Ignavibacteriae bacterium HGW-Ignavibacteriae-4]
MNPVVGFIAPNNNIKICLEDLFSEEILNGKLIIEVLQWDETQILEQAKSLNEKGASVIIARGGTYDIIKQNLSITSVHLRINTTDILHALNEAKLLKRKNYLVLHESVFFNYQEWSELINVKVELVLRYNKVEDIKEIIHKIRSLDENAVVVGGSHIVSKAEHQGLTTVFINNTKGSILETYDQAINLAKSLRDGEKKLKMLASILDNVIDAVLVVNKKGYIEHANDPARKLFKVNSSGTPQDNIQDVLPELELIFEVLEDMKLSNHILKAGEFVLNVNAVPLEIAGEKVGIVCIAQDITKIQSLERKIRYQLHQKGLVAKRTFEDIITHDNSMIHLIDAAKEYALTDFTILIYGESGTGKEMFAQSIHNWSKRRNAPFVAVNCAALSESLLESELFGYDEGAFTGARKGGKQGLFELAHGGTIFLDEINSISLKLQSKLLRVIEEKEVMRLGSDYVIPLDIRIIVASNEELTEKLINNEFRSDLFFRISVLELRIPPLRERKNDILLLFKGFLQELKLDKTNLSPELEEFLVKHKWQGNVRELRNVAERYRLLKDKEKYVDILGYGQYTRGKEISLENMKIDLKEMNRMVENMVIETLINQGIPKKDIASFLGISRIALWKKINPER